MKEFVLNIKQILFTKTSRFLFTYENTDQKVLLPPLIKTVPTLIQIKLFRLSIDESWEFF